MTADVFVKGFYLERQFLIDRFFDPESQSEVSAIIKSLDLDDKQTERLRQVLSGALTDALYRVLLGLDGEASIGGIQTTYKLLDEENNELSGGDIEAFAYDYFHNNKFQFDKGQADFIATLNYLTVEEGGREKPAFSGYRPHLKFDFSEMQTSGQQTFIDRKIVYPGDTVEAEIKIVAIEHFAGKLKEKMKFEFREGERTIGTGQITRIVNNNLKK
jgi:hypothetical protein